MTFERFLQRGFTILQNREILEVSGKAGSAFSLYVLLVSAERLTWFKVTEKTLGEAARVLKRDPRTVKAWAQRLVDLGYASWEDGALRPRRPLAEAGPRLRPSEASEQEARAPEQEAQIPKQKLQAPTEDGPQASPVQDEVSAPSAPGDEITVETTEEEKKVHLSSPASRETPPASPDGQKSSSLEKSPSRPKGPGSPVVAVKSALSEEAWKGIVKNVRPYCHSPKAFFALVAEMARSVEVLGPEVFAAAAARALARLEAGGVRYPVPYLRRVLKEAVERASVRPAPPAEGGGPPSDDLPPMDALVRLPNGLVGRFAGTTGPGGSLAWIVTEEGVAHRVPRAALRGAVLEAA